MRLHKPLTAESLREVLDYDPGTGIFTWKVNRGGSTAKKGSIAGTFHPSGYRAIQIFGKAYYEHRLAWLWVHGVWPDTIDHRNHDKSDNRLINLENVAQWQNNQTKRPWGSLVWN